MRLLQHLQQHLAESRHNFFGVPTDSERAARAAHDNEVAAMAQRLDEEMAIRTGCNGTPRADERGTQEGDDMGTWGYIWLIAIVVGIAASWDWMRSRRMRREVEKQYETSRRANERLQKRVHETIARGTRLTPAQHRPAPPAPAARPAPSARPAPAVDKQSWPWPEPAFAPSAIDSAPARRHGGDDSHHLFSAGGGSFDGGGSSGDWSSGSSCSSSSSSDSGSSGCSSD